MSRCYLCGKDCRTVGADYGRRSILDCKECGLYEVGPAAAGKLEAPEFPDTRRAQIRRTLAAFNDNRGTAEIVFENETLSVRTKLEQ